MSCVGVIDCNNFFVSCERLFRPDLQNKPVAVLSSNDGCIVARSQEVKDMGVPMGVPYFKVKDIIKDNDVTLFSSHFALYRDVSRRVFTILREELEHVQQYSVDEAFFTILKQADPAEVAKRVKQVIERKVGVPVSVGVGISKTQAKYAVELAKRTKGVKVLESGEWKEMRDSVKLSEIWGVGGKSSANYRKAGFVTVADLLAADPAQIKSLFGVVGERLQAELSENSVFEVGSEGSEQKSMMSTRSFKETTTNKAVLEDAVAYHTRHIASDLRTQKQLASVIRVSIQPSRHSDFMLQGASLEAILDVPTNDTFKLLNVTQGLLNKAFKAGVPYKKAGVMVGHMVSTEIVQQTLFSKPEPEERGELLQMIDSINKQANGELISIGDRQRGDNWKARRDLVSPAYTTKWTDVAVVSA